MRHATVVSYSPGDRYGFLRDEQGQDYFLGGNILDVAGICNLVAGQAVLFDAVMDRRGRGWRVSKIALADHSAVAA